MPPAPSGERIRYGPRWSPIDKRIVVKDPGNKIDQDRLPKESSRKQR